MPTPAELWQSYQRQVSAATAAAVVRSWGRISLVEPQRSFAVVLPELIASVTSGQLAAAGGASGFVSASVTAAGATPQPVATVAPQRFAGLASDGRPLDGLLTQPLLRALYLRTSGADDETALLGGRLSLETLVKTEIYDTGRDATAVAAGLDRSVAGYIRQVSGAACDRCLVLAGKFFRTNDGFERHPRCDCTHEIVADRPDDIEQTPRDLFDRMTPEQQNRSFGKTNAEVIRRGGDIGQVVNARRGMATAGSNWTTEGTTVRGSYGRAAVARGQEAVNRGRRNREVAPRPSPGALLRFAKNPDEFARALERAGYL